MFESEQRDEARNVVAEEYSRTIKELAAQIAELKRDKERLDWIERNHPDITFEGVEAEYVEGGSIGKDLWEVYAGYRIVKGVPSDAEMFPAGMVQDCMAVSNRRER